MDFPTLKVKESKATNKITDYLLDKFYAFLSLLSLLPYPRLQYKLLKHFFDNYFNYFEPIIKYYEIYNMDTSKLLEEIP